MDAGTENLWQSFRDRLRAFVRSRVKDDAAVEDILQRAFLQMHQALRGGKSLDDPHAWVFAVTRNALRDHYRTEKSQTSRVAAAAEELRVMPEPGVGVTPVRPLSSRNAWNRYCGGWSSPTETRCSGSPLMA